MSQCYYDTIFQRVFCVTLVAIASTFTVILTNVFVDIDGILSSKETAKNYDAPVPTLENEMHQVKMTNLIRTEPFYKEERNYDEDNDENYRNKRSLESPNFLFHMKNPKVKNILTNRLANLLEELDAEETVPEENVKDISIKTNLKPNIKEEENKVDLLAAITDGGYRNQIKEKKDEEDMLHLAMHNILLQGIIGHMDLNDVYNKVHSLVRNFKDVKDGETPKEKRVQNKENNSDRDLFSQKDYPVFKPQKQIKRNNKKPHNPSIEENKFFDEMIKCDKLQNDITNTNEMKNSKRLKEIRLNEQKEPKLLIKTIIDITSPNKDKTRKEMKTNSKETIKGIIKLIYNGKSIRFSRMEEEDNQLIKQNNQSPQPDEITPKDEKVIKDTKDNANEPLNVIKQHPERTSNSNAYLNKIIDDYFKKYPKNKDDVVYDRYNEDTETRRIKRHIKIRYEDNESTTLSSKPKRKNENNDDELYVEIETHFDSKGMKGDKKKKLIRSIIEKIQKAIHSDIDKFNDGNKKKHKHLQVKKRIQNPLDKDKKLLINKIMLPFDTIEQRHSDPISKAVYLQHYAPVMTETSDENWRKNNFGPGFLTASKSLNSAQTGDVDVDYNKIVPTNGIPQRLQKPLNTDVSEEMLNDNTYFDLGNLKFFVKNIDGTGLSIGFNQYTDEAPDPETVKLFTGIEQLVKTYRNDEVQGSEGIPQDRTKTSMSEERDHQMKKRELMSNKNKHVLFRRSTQEKDYHSNEYKIIFDDNFLPYKSYQEIYEGKKKKVALTIDKETENINTFEHDSDNVEIIRKNIEIKEMPAFINENNNIFYKNLKPSEILSIANLLDRKKRSLVTHKITNLKKKIKVNRYLNTRPKGKRKIILNKKRRKRQIDKIRIIATDAGHKPRHSEDNIFFVNDENLLADRAIIREVETPEVVDVDDKMTEQYDVVPLMYDDSPFTHVFNGRSRHNQLMSKYPHIFMEEVSKSKEDYEPIVVSKFEMKPTNHYAPADNNNYAMPTEPTTTMAEVSIPKLEDLVNAIDPKQNYKLTVKILPKNMTGVNSGFKEIHASINKSFNKNGLRYSSLVNVSEISKIENLHNTTEPTNIVTALSTPSPFIKRIQEQQNRMDALLKQHKKRIDEQLDHLRRERLNLDTISVKTLQEKVTENFDVTTLKPDSLLQMSNDDVSKLLASALFQLQSQNDFATTVQSSTTTTAQPTTKLTMAEPKPEININDKINSEILNQINRNTEMLQTFLQKLTDKLSKEREPIRRNSDETKPAKFDYIPKYWKPFPGVPETYQPPFDIKNDTHIPVPLVYAYQPPYPMNNFKHPVQHLPIASVVYHGHIHTDSLNALKKNAIPKDTWTDPKILHEKNQTKYFIDEMVDFKVAPVKEDEKKPLIDGVPKSTTVKV